MRMQKEMSERVADEVFVMLCLALPMPKHGTHRQTGCTLLPSINKHAPVLHSIALC
jgi:hypothetical protein